MKLKNRLDYRRRRHRRLRTKVSGTPSRPRMCVSITHQHIYVQFIDDMNAVTLAELSTLRDRSSGKNNMNTAQVLGKQVAELAIKKGIHQAVFDRGGHAYTGRVKAIAEAARAAGIKL